MSDTVTLKSEQNTFAVHNAELWTAKQRQMHPLHYSVSYRASFKPELPDFFINRYLLSRNIQSGVVLDPFGGRGTTAIQANLCGFAAVHNDLSPVSVFLARSRQFVPSFDELKQRLDAVKFNGQEPELSDSDYERLKPFFHDRTIHEICCLRSEYFKSPDDPALSYLMHTALSRLHGHSDGFFSVYSFPQISILPQAQHRNNIKRGLRPEYKSVKERIEKKMKRDLSRPVPPHYYKASALNKYLNGSAENLQLPASSVDLVVTSPPFLDKVDYRQDNWMRAWFLGLEDTMKKTKLSIFADTADWSRFMASVMKEMLRVLKPGRHAVIEVGEVSVGKETVYLEKLMMDSLPVTARGYELSVKEVFINQQSFTKLANCWDVSNNAKGTNTNRCLVVEKLRR